MFYLTLRKKAYCRFSYNILLFNSRKRVIKKLGSFSFNKMLNIFILNINFFELFILFKKGIFFNISFFKVLMRYLNSFKL